MPPLTEIAASFVEPNLDRWLLVLPLAIVCALAAASQRSRPAPALQPVVTASAVLLALILAWAAATLLMRSLGMPKDQWAAPLDRLLGAGALVALAWALIQPAPDSRRRWQILLGVCLGLWLLVYAFWAPRWSAVLADNPAAAADTFTVSFRRLMDLWLAALALLVAGAALLQRQPRLPDWLNASFAGLAVFACLGFLFPSTESLLPVWFRVGLALAGVLVSAALFQAREALVPAAPPTDTPEGLAPAGGQANMPPGAARPIDPRGREAGVLASDHLAPVLPPALGAVAGSAAVSGAPSDPLVAGAPAPDLAAAAEPVAPPGLATAPATPAAQVLGGEAEDEQPTEVRRLLEEVRALQARLEALDAGVAEAGGPRAVVEEAGTIPEAGAEDGLPPLRDPYERGTPPPVNGGSAAHSNGAAYAALVPDLLIALQAPLNSIDAYRKLLDRRHELSTDDVGRYLRRLDANLVRLNILLDDLRLALAPGARDSAAADQPSDVARLVHAAIARARPQLEEKGLQIKSDLAEPLDGLAVDAALVTRITENLLVAAAQRSPQGGSVELKAGARRMADGQSALELGVRDQGQALERAGAWEVDSVHDVLARVALRIVERLAESRGGRVWTTVDPGGTGFHVRLMVRPEA